jgi:hypothetical protein
VWGTNHESQHSYFNLLRYKHSQHFPVPDYHLCNEKANLTPHEIYEQTTQDNPLQEGYVGRSYFNKRGQKKKFLLGINEVSITLNH